MGTITVPEMKKKNCNMKLATGSVAAGGTLGILIPPSAVYLFYAMIIDLLRGELFIAGLVLGILMAVLFIVSNYIAVVRNPERDAREDSM